MLQSKRKSVVKPLLSARALVPLILSVQKVAKAAKNAFGADGVTVSQFNEASAGQSVFHLHFHVIPRFTGMPLKPHAGKMEDRAVIEANAEKLRKALAAG